MRIPRNRLARTRMSATGSPPTVRSLPSVISAPIALRILMTPMRVGFTPTCSSVRSEPGAIAAPTRDHTERMQISYGYEVERRGNTVCVRGGGRLRATHIDVPADISSAARNAQRRRAAGTGLDQRAHLA